MERTTLETALPVKKAYMSVLPGQMRMAVQILSHLPGQSCLHGIREPISGVH